MRRTVIAALVVIVAIAVALVISGRAGEWASAERLTALVQDAGVLGPILFVVLIVALFPVFLIGPPVWSSLALWPAPLAVLYSFAGCFAASAIAYWLAGFLGREQAQSRVPDRIRRYEERLVRSPFWTIVVMRILIWANPAVDLLLGISRISRRDYLLGTAVGLLPATAFHVLVVGTGLGMAFELPTEVWISVGIGIGALVLVRAIRGRRAAAAETADLPRDAS